MPNDEQPDSAPPRYPNIFISGNARAILGDVHGLDEDFLRHDAQPAQWTTRFTRHFHEDPRRQGGHLDQVLYSLRLAAILIKDFDDVRSIMNKIRQTSSIIERYAKEIEVRQAILKSSVFNILTSYAGAQSARSMMQDDDHSMWTTVRILDIGCALDAKDIQTVLALISQDIEAIGGIVKNCVAIKCEGSKASAFPRCVIPVMGGRDIKANPDLSIQPAETSTQYRIRSILRENGLARHLKALQTNTQDFRDLTKQPLPPTERLQSARRGPETKDKVERLRAVQLAAAELYRAFVLACGQHDKHQACLRIHANHAKPDQIQFTLFFGHVTSSANKELWRSAHMRLVVESQLRVAPDQAITQYEPVRPRSTTVGAKRRRDTHDPSNASRILRDSPGIGQVYGESKLPREKQEHSNSPVHEPHEACVPLLLAGSSALELPNFCHNHDFCAYIKNLASSGLAESLPLGYFDRLGSSKHIVYLHTGSEIRGAGEHDHQAQYRRHALSSIRDMLQSSGESQTISRRDLVRVAKQLAMAVLQYNTTPWLESSWDSDHILLERGDDAVQVFGSEAENPPASADSSDSYLDVSIRKMDDPTALNRLNATSRTMIRNPILFRLGVMLLELAYAQPLRDMQRPQDIDPHNDYNTDYYTAERLQQRVSTQMGPVFAEIVRKCIKCDFGHGEDLATGQLQEGFYEDVIDKLESIEAKFKDLGI